MSTVTKIIIILALCAVLGCTYKFKMQTPTIDIESEAEICSAKTHTNKALCPTAVDNAPPVESTVEDCGLFAWFWNRSCIQNQASSR